MAAFNPKPWFKQPIGTKISINKKYNPFLKNGTKIKIHKNIFDNDEQDPRIYGVSSTGNKYQTVINNEYLLAAKYNWYSNFFIIPFFRKNKFILFINRY